MWDTLNDEAKSSIVIKLKAMFDTLRKLPSLGGYCSIGYRRLLDNMFWTARDDEPLSGPFATEAEVVNALVKKHAYNNLPRGRGEFYQRVLPQVLRHHPPRFSHSDLQFKNIIITSNSNSTSSIEGDLADEYLPIIIDWESAGWYPSYWEYSRAMATCGRWKDNLSVWIEKILDPYYNEWAWMNMLIVELWS